MILAGPRVYFAMARDGLFFIGEARIHPRYQTPARLSWRRPSGAASSFCRDAVSALTYYTGFAVVLFAGVAVAAVFVLRQREPEAPRPFSAWGYPVAPAMFVLASLVIVGNELWSDLVTSAGLAGDRVGPLRCLLMHCGRNPSFPALHRSRL